MPRALHIFRNTPLGRETLFQSLDLCKRFNFSLSVYIPKDLRFLMYFENEVIQVDLDKSYLTSREAAEQRVEELSQEWGVTHNFLTPKDYTAEVLPNLPNDFNLMCCPRSISDLSSKIGMGHVGPRVRRIVQCAHFPVLIPSPVFKQWKSVTVLFGGSKNALKAFRLAVAVSRLIDVPIDLFTFEEGGRDRPHLEQILADEGLTGVLSTAVRRWEFCPKREIVDGLYAVPHDALVVAGAYGHGAIKEVLFGSTMETVQSTMTNNLLVVGPNCDVDRFTAAKG